MVVLINMVFAPSIATSECHVIVAECPAAGCLRVKPEFRQTMKVMIYMTAPKRPGAKTILIKTDKSRRSKRN